MDTSLHIPLDNADKIIRLLQLTDCHIGPRNEEILLGLNTHESLDDVIHHVGNNEDEFDVFLATGDISNNGGVNTYRRFLSIVQSSPIKHKGFAWLPGNHDSPDDMNEALGTSSLVKEVVAGNWLFILLNTQVPGHTHGNLSESELNVLDEILLRNTDKHIMIFMHHQPVPVGCAWVDNQQVRSEYAFFKILDQYENIKAVVWGHVHQEFNQHRNNVDLMSTPSTCIQFKAKSDEFAVDNLMPGYRTFELKPDGTFFTKVIRIPKKKYPIEFQSAGY